MAQLRLKSEDRLTALSQQVRNVIKTLPILGDSPRVWIDPKEVSQLSSISVDNIKAAIKELKSEGFLSSMFEGRREKKHLYALLNPEFKGTAREVWV